MRALSLVLLAALAFAACGSDDVENASDSSTTEAPAAVEVAEVPAEEVAEAPVEEAAGVAGEPVVSVRESGLTVTVQDLGDVVLHSLTATEPVFANSTHLVETENSLVVFDTQFLLPNAMDMRAYADEIGKPIDRVFITHEHPDHFLGSEAFADVPIFALADVAEKIIASGDAEIAEKQADFGAEAIAGTFVAPEVVEPGIVEIDGVTFDLAEVVGAEAESQLVVRLPDHGAVVVGDIVYNSVHMVLAGPFDTWTAALEVLASTSDEYPIVLAGHGLPAGPNVYDENIEYLAVAGELLGTVDNGADFKQGLVDAYPSYGMDAAIDLVLGFFFPPAE